MSASSADVLIIGGGGDALVAATLLARAGRRVQVLVREESAAGPHRTIELAPGITSRISLEADWVPDAVLRALKLSIELDAPRIPASVALPDGGLLPLSRHIGDAQTAIRAHSPRDAERWPAFMTAMHQLAGFLEKLYVLPAPDLDAGLGELPSLLSLGKSFRGLGKANMTELLRVLPMAVQDLADEWFTFPALQAALGAAATRDIRQGPRSGGTSFVLLHYLTGAEHGSLRGRRWLTPGDSGEALIAQVEQLARASGVEIRTSTDVTRISVRDDAVTGVVLANGDEIAARSVVSAADPARTLLGMIDSVWLDPEFLLAVKNIKLRGSTAIVAYHLDALPFDAGSGLARSLTGIVSLSSTLDTIEKAYDAAKYGAASEAPHIELSMPSILQTGASGKHVLVARVQWVPHTPRAGAWTLETTAALGDRVTAAITRVIPRLGEFVRRRVVLTPRDIAERFGVTDGALTHGEMTLDQILFMRPVAGWGRYATPIAGLYVAGPGTHPGPGVFGASGLLAARRILADAKANA